MERKDEDGDAKASSGSKHSGSGGGAKADDNDDDDSEWLPPAAGAKAGADDDDDDDDDDAEGVDDASPEELAAELAALERALPTTPGQKADGDADDGDDENSEAGKLAMRLVSHYLAHIQPHVDALAEADCHLFDPSSAGGAVIDPAAPDSGVEVNRAHTQRRTQRKKTAHFPRSYDTDRSANHPLLRFCGPSSSSLLGGGQGGEHSLERFAAFRRFGARVDAEVGTWCAAERVPEAALGAALGAAARQARAGRDNLTTLLLELLAAADDYARFAGYMAGEAERLKLEAEVEEDEGPKRRKGKK